MRIESRAVKKLLLIGVGSALMFTMGGVGPAQADSNGAIHRSTAAIASETQLVSVGGGRCAGCHRAHTAKAEKLLKQAQPALCYTCHGGGGSNLDVVNGMNDNAAPTAPRGLRGGGFEFALIDGALASKTMPATLDQYAHPASEQVPVKAALGATAVTSRHQIDGLTTGTMWGNGAISDTVSAPLAAGKTGVKLECASCHDPHGNGNYRILKAVPNDAATKAATGVAAVVVLPVNIPDALTKIYTTTNYWSVADGNVPTVTGGALPVAGTGLVPNVATVADTTDSTDGNLILVGKGATDGYITNVSQWCSTCHTRYLAASGSYATPNKGYDVATKTNSTTGITDATFTYRHRSDRADKEGLNVPNCIQCHVSHGSNVAMTSDAASVSNPDGTDTGGASGSMAGSSRLLRVDNRGTCEMCHNV